MEAVGNVDCPVAQESRGGGERQEGGEAKESRAKREHVEHQVRKP